MEGERLDLSALDLLRDREHFEQVVSAIMERARPELALRADQSVLGVLGKWAWPLLAAASLVAVLSGGALTLLQPEQPLGGVVQALRLSAPVSVWLEEGGPITTGDVLIALDQGGTE